MVRQSPRRPHEAGYSLLEIIIVVAIIGLLVTLVAPQVFGRLDQSRVTAAEAQIRMLRSALDSYRLDVGTYPSGSDGLSALITRPSSEQAELWRGPYLDGGQLPLDPWGRPYAYSADAGDGSPQIVSLGADGRAGGSGINADIGVRAAPDQGVS